MYTADEHAALRSLLTSFQDVWRELHPDERTAFTVWDEKTSARAFNDVCIGCCTVFTLHKPTPLIKEKMNLQYAQLR